MKRARLDLSLRRATVLLLVAALAGLFGSAVFGLSREPAGLTAQVAARLSESGVEHAVTAVLLNFRGYDTWLELGVLLLALTGCLGVLQRRDLTGAEPPENPSELLTALVRLLVPVMVLVAGYLLWLGKAAAGGAFQAGVVLAAAWVLMWYGGRRGLASLSPALWRTLAVAGLLGFLAVALITLAIEGVMLGLPTHLAGAIILALELLATVSIGVTLAALIIAPQSGAPKPAENG
jgi:multisubunit Na+/H+ antiporter MnhB subunit